MIRRWIFGSAALVGALALTLAAPGDAHARRSRCCGCNQYAYAGGMTQAYGTGGAVNGATDGIAPQAYGNQGYGGAGYDGAGYGGAGYGGPGRARREVIRVTPGRDTAPKAGIGGMGVTITTTMEPP